ncbi:MAG: hypothetical protein JSV94_00100 [Methanobacteriota archaeon]|nr:MAG: hypothetical protein JSV94_00100 [Euryarchaeota archaeon]
MNPRFPNIVFVAIACVIMTTTAFSEFRSAGSEDYALFVSVDDAKVCFISGNFSVAITRDWPRVIFKHEEDPFSPTFEVSCPRMYGHNDTDGDGLFDLSEATYTMFLDSNHVEWNMTSIEQGFNNELGEYAAFGMGSSLNAYLVENNETLVLSDWASLMFWFSISEKSAEYTNSMGSYVIDGGTQLRMNFSLSVKDYIEMDALVLERFLQGGGSTNMFHLIESTGDDEAYVTKVSGTIDERESEEAIIHEFSCTSEPMQEILFAKEDGIAQAFYRWDSKAISDYADNTSISDLESSYFTTGNGMMLHSRLEIDNRTLQVAHEASVGLLEAGFVGSVSDWIREYSWSVLIVCSVAIALVLIPVFLRRGRKGPREKESK